MTGTSQLCVDLGPVFQPKATSAELCSQGWAWAERGRGVSSPGGNWTRSPSRSCTCEECIQSRVPRGCGEWEEGSQDLLSHLGRSLSAFSLLWKVVQRTGVSQAVVSIDGQFPVSSSSFAPSISCLDLFPPLGRKLQEGWAASGSPAHARCLGPN